MKTIAGLVVAAMIALPLGAASASQTIVDKAQEAGNFKTLLKAAEAAGLVDTLKGSGPYTLFAPNDAAFAKIEPGVMANLMKPENKEELAGLLKHHLVPGKVLAVDIRNSKDMKVVKNARGGELKINGGATITIGDAKVISADIMASNGVIHVIDAVIDPEP